MEHVQLLRPVRERRRTSTTTAHDVAPADRPDLDRWVLSRLQGTIAAVRDELDDYDTTSAGRSIAAFVDDLSNWYVRRSRAALLEEPASDGDAQRQASPPT